MEGGVVAEECVSAPEITRTPEDHRALLERLLAAPALAGWTDDESDAAAVALAAYMQATD